MSYGIYPKGIIYDSKKSKSQGEFILRAKPLARFIYGLINGAAAGLIGFIVIFLVFSLYPIVKEEILYRTGQKEIKIVKSGFGELLKTVEAERILTTQAEARSFGINSYFSLVIPKIGATANITANVDAGNENEYLEALKKGVAHAKGTYFPGQGKMIYLFAHSTDTPFNVLQFNAVFFLLNELEKNDQIIIFFLDKKYVYEVIDKKIVAPDETSWFSVGNEEKLILQTCYPPGTTWQRLLLIAKRIE